jgi:hypothetical protein
MDPSKAVIEYKEELVKSQQKNVVIHACVLAHE